MRPITRLYQTLLIFHALYFSFLLLRDVGGSDKYVLIVDLLSIIVFPMTGLSLHKWFSNKSQTRRVVLLLGMTGLIFLYFLMKSIFNHGHTEVNPYSFIAGLFFIWTITYLYAVITKK